MFQAKSALMCKNFSLPLSLYTLVDSLKLVLDVVKHLLGLTLEKGWLMGLWGILLKSFLWFLDSSFCDSIEPIATTAIHCALFIEIVVFFVIHTKYKSFYVYDTVSEEAPQEEKPEFAHYKALETALEGTFHRV